jgi:hypothetical protein
MYQVRYIVIVLISYKDRYDRTSKYELIFEIRKTKKIAATVSVLNEFIIIEYWK